VDFGTTVSLVAFGTMVSSVDFGTIVLTGGICLSISDFLKENMKTNKPTINEIIPNTIRTCFPFD
jgi:hypothetical protein